MTMRFSLTAGVCLLAAALATSVPKAEILDVVSMPLDPQQTEIRARIGDSTARLPRLAVPAFLTADAEVQEAGKILTDVLWKDLEFEREFQMIAQGGDAAKIAPVPAEALVYESWSQVGADEVLVGGVRRTDASLQVEVRVMSVDRKVSTFGKRYTCSARAMRECAHTISDELHKERFGVDGVARTRFAFVSDRDGERIRGVEPRVVKEIYMSDYDGERPSRVTRRGSLNVAPSWSPDGRAIVYQSYQTGFADIFIQRLFDVQVQAARPGRGTERAQNMLPAWSPDGSRIAFQSNRDGAYDIYTVKPDGSDLRRLTSDRAWDGSPVWSPNGRQIAFTSDRGGSNQVYIMSADGGPAEKLTDEPRKADRPTWALDYIAYSAEIPGDGIQLKRITVGDRKVIQLTTGGGRNESPTVAPNGRHIAFVTTRWGGRDQIAVMDADGQNIRQITRTGNNRFPSWSPGPQGK
jgi:TolB protein